MANWCYRDRQTQWVTVNTRICGSVSTAAGSYKFLGSQVTTDAGLLAYRELDEMLGLMEMGADRPPRTDAWEVTSSTAGCPCCGSQPTSQSTGPVMKT